MAGGYKTFGPSYNATKYVRVLHEGMVNGNHNIAPEVIDAGTEDLAGRIASVTATGIAPAQAGGAGAVGLFTEDLGDMTNASLKGSFYFRGGEYYVSVARMGTGADALTPGAELTTDSEGKLVAATADQKVVGVVTMAAAPFPMGNMYDHAPNQGGGDFVGFILYL